MRSDTPTNGCAKSTQSLRATVMCSRADFPTIERFVLTLDRLPSRIPVISSNRVAIGNTEALAAGKVSSRPEVVDDRCGSFVRNPHLLARDELTTRFGTRRSSPSFVLALPMVASVPGTTPTSLRSGTVGGGGVGGGGVGGGGLGGG